MADRIAIIGCGPAGIMSAINFARRGVATVVIEASDDPSTAPSYNPDRSYAIDVTGHGLNAVTHIDAVDDFDRELIPFKGIDAGKGGIHPWKEPGWIGSRGDIMRVLMKIVTEKHSGTVSFRFNCPVTAIDFETGSLTCDSKDEEREIAEKYDLIIAADGGGSIIRKQAEQNVAGFTLSHRDASYYCKMIALDQAVGKLDETLLQVLSLRYPCVAGAINGPDGKDDPIWFCQVPFSSNKSFRDMDEARSFLATKSPRILDLASEQAIETFSKCESQNIGRSIMTSRCYAGKVIFIGDACASYPPIGQGANAALESAMVLDQSVAAICPDGAAIGGNMLEVARHFDTRWRDEARSVSWAANKFKFTNKWHVLRVQIAGLLNCNVVEETKSSKRSYSEVRKRAKYVWPLWAIS